MNTATRKTAPKSRRIVTLDPSQFALYQTGNIELHSPTGELLDTVGTLAARDEAEVSLTRLQDQLHLVECLLCNGSYPLELSERAGAGLVDLLHQANEFLN
jgi:hypothetical protein